MEQKFFNAYRYDDGKATGGASITKNPKVKRKGSILCMFRDASKEEEKITDKKNPIEGLSKPSTISILSSLSGKEKSKLSVSSKERHNVIPVEKGEKEYLAGLNYCQRAQYQDALRCFKEAAAQQYPAAYLWLGCLYENDGLVGPKNLEESMKWYNKAKEEMSWFETKAESNQVDAQYNLGWCYNFGIGTAKNVKEAVRYYQLAAAQGYAPAQSSLAWCYEYGEGVDKDAHKALHYYRLAANQGWASAQHSLGWFYQYGEEKHVHKAILYYQLAANQGYANAQNNLGYCYKNGEGVEKDVEKAVHYYQLAADQGHARAQYHLGRCYEEGKGINKDIAKALHYYRLAANQGDGMAQYRLDRCSLYPEGAEKNFKEPMPYSSLYLPTFFSLHASHLKDSTNDSYLQGRSRPLLNGICEMRA